MSANANPVAQPKECPVCMNRFNTAANVPKVFGVCGHSVRADCLPGCVYRQPERQAQGQCPLCRQKTAVPQKGLPTNYALIDSLESQHAAGNAASVKCSGCEKNVPPSDVFACKNCTASERKVVLVCGVCGMKRHKAHDVVEHNAMANEQDLASRMRDERLHNDSVRRRTTAMASVVTDEMKRIDKDCHVDVDANLPLSLMTKDEHDRHTKKSADRRIQKRK